MEATWVPRERRASRRRLVAVEPKRRRRLHRGKLDLSKKRENGWQVKLKRWHEMVLERGIAQRLTPAGVGDDGGACGRKRGNSEIHELL